MTAPTLRDEIGDVHPVQNYVNADEVMLIIRRHLTGAPAVERLRLSLYDASGHMPSFVDATAAVNALLDDAP